MQLCYWLSISGNRATHVGQPNSCHCLSQDVASCLHSLLPLAPKQALSPAEISLDLCYQRYHRLRTWSAPSSQTSIPDMTAAFSITRKQIERLSYLEFEETDGKAPYSSLRRFSCFIQGLTRLRGPIAQASYGRVSFKPAIARSYSATLVLSACKF
jgi:hypothetical protein